MNFQKQMEKERNYLTKYTSHRRSSSLWYQLIESAYYRFLPHFAQLSRKYITLHTSSRTQESITGGSLRSAGMITLVGNNNKSAAPRADPHDINQPIWLKAETTNRIVVVRGCTS